MVVIDFLLSNARSYSSGVGLESECRGVGAYEVEVIHALSPPKGALPAVPYGSAQRTGPHFLESRKVFVSI